MAITVQLLSFINFFICSLIIEVETVTFNNTQNGINVQRFRKLKPKKEQLNQDDCIDPTSARAKRAQRYFLGVAIVVKEEKDFIQEWAHHYISEGVERFYMIDQESYHTKQRYKQDLVLGSTSFEIEKFFPNKTCHLVAPALEGILDAAKKAVQSEADIHRTHLSVANMPNMAPSYRRIVDAAKREGCQWLIFVDSDEFMYASSPRDTINAVIRRLALQTPVFGQISIPWTLMGSSGHVKMPKCVISSFKWAFHPLDATPVKSVLRLDALRDSSRIQVHRQQAAALCPKWKSLNSDGSIANTHPHVIKSFPTKAPLMRLNHYWYRSLQFALDVKACRSMKMANMTHNDVDLFGLIQTMHQIDSNADRCDTLLTERQLYGTHKFSITNAFSKSSPSLKTSSSYKSQKFDITSTSFLRSNTAPSTSTSSCPPSSTIQALVAKEASLTDNQVIANLLVGTDPLQSESLLWNQDIGRSDDEKILESKTMQEAFVDLGSGCGIIVSSAAEIEKMDVAGLLTPVRTSWGECKLRSRSEYQKLGI